MKQLITVILFLLLSTGAALAGTEVREIDRGVITSGKSKMPVRQAVMHTRPFCMFGQQFFATIIEKDASSHDSGVSVTQVLLPGRAVHPPQPMTCREDSRAPVSWK